MAVGRCHLSLRRHWHRPETDIGGLHEEEEVVEKRLLCGDMIG